MEIQFTIEMSEKCKLVINDIMMLAINKILLSSLIMVTVREALRENN